MPTEIDKAPFGSKQPYGKFAGTASGGSKSYGGVCFVGTRSPVPEERKGIRHKTQEPKNLLRAKGMTHSISAPRPRLCLARHAAIATRRSDEEFPGGRSCPRHSGWIRGGSGTWGAARAGPRRRAGSEWGPGDDAGRAVCWCHGQEDEWLRNKQERLFRKLGPVGRPDWAC